MSVTDLSLHPSFLLHSSPREFAIILKDAANSRFVYTACCVREIFQRCSAYFCSRICLFGEVRLYFWRVPRRCETPHTPSLSKKSNNKQILAPTFDSSSHAPPSLLHPKGKVRRCLQPVVVLLFSSLESCPRGNRVVAIKKGAWSGQAGRWTRRSYCQVFLVCLGRPDRTRGNLTLAARRVCCGLG